MKLYQINASYKPAFTYGGPTMSVSKLSEVLIKNKVDVEVLTTTANGRDELSVVPGQKVVVEDVPVTFFKRLTKDHTHFSPSLYLALNRKISQHNSQERIIIHIHTWWNLVSVFSCLIALLKKVPVVLSPRGTLSTYSFSNRNNLLKKVIHFLFGKPLLKKCHFHVTSENEKKAILALTNPKSITVIPNLVSLPKKAPALLNDTADNEAFKLLFLSRIEQKKGLELLFSALKNLQLNYSLTIAGTGDQGYIDDLIELSKSLKISERICWIGHQSPDTKFDVMAVHHLLVLPSYDENFANVIIESLASGTAVLITENVGLSDYIIENDFGWVCQTDKKELSNSLMKAATSRDKLEIIRQTAPSKIRIDFSDSKVSKRYIEMYKTILQDV